jgi:hypothetical protein
LEARREWTAAKRSVVLTVGVAVVAEGHEAVVVVAGEIRLALMIELANYDVPLVDVQAIRREWAVAAGRLTPPSRRSALPQPGANS